MKFYVKILKAEDAEVILNPKAKIKEEEAPVAGEETQKKETEEPDEEEEKEKDKKTG